MANFKVTREEFQVIYNQGADAVYALVEGLLLQVNLLAARVQQLENQINTNSRNKRLPELSTATPVGLFSPALVAGPPSPEQPRIALSARWS